jgi:hypothetical protein
VESGLSSVVSKAQAFWRSMPCLWEGLGCQINCDVLGSKPEREPISSAPKSREVKRVGVVRRKSGNNRESGDGDTLVIDRRWCGQVEG